MHNNKIILFFTILFVIFLYPFSISLANEDGASANYLFLLFPFFLGLYNRKFIKPKIFWIISISIFTLIFILGTLYQYNYFHLIIRRLISFILFMSIFSFIYIVIKDTVNNPKNIGIIIYSKKLKNNAIRYMSSIIFFTLLFLDIFSY